MVIRFANVALLLSCLLAAGCSTASQNVAAHGLPCEHLGQFALGEHDAPLVCNEAAGGASGTEATKGIGGVWGIVGIDKPIAAKGTPNANCAHVGALAVADDGSVLRCVWNNPDLNNATGAGHGD